MSSMNALGKLVSFFVCALLTAGAAQAGTTYYVDDNGTGNINADPFFVDAEGPDGIVGTADDNLRLLAGSPAINAGTNAPPGGLPSTDLDGNPRVVHRVVDMGAYELAYEELRVHNVVQDTYYATIQSAIENALNDEVIEVSPGVYHEAINFLGKAITLRSIDGPGVTIIDATGLGQVSVVTCGSGEGPDTVLKGFTIKGGDPLGARGGGMVIAQSSPTVTSCTFSQNHAKWGAGMYIWASSPTVTNSVFVGNYANNTGAGMYIWEGNPAVINCVFTGNSSGMSGGATAMYIADASPKVTNCIFWGDYPQEIYSDAESTPIVTYSNVQGSCEGIGNIERDPLFLRNPSPGPDGWWGTEDDDVGDLRLQDTSPSLDVGNDKAIARLSVGSDPDGNPRIMDGDADGAPRVDMGAYEYSDCNGNSIRDICDTDCTALRGACNVPDCGLSSDKDGDGFPDECETIHNVTQDTHDATIQIAIDRAPAEDVIEVPPGSYREAVNFFGKALTLRSTDGPEVTTIHGSGLGTSVVRCVSGEGSDTVLKGFTITSGTGTTDRGTGETFGGGMYIAHSDPTVIGCRFTQNLAFFGGGVASLQGSPTVTDCSFTRNLSYSDGGGVYCSENCAATLLNCLFRGNSAIQNGGALAINASAPTVTNCTFSKNSAGISGGAVSSSSASPTLTNCILWGDTPDEIEGTAIVTYSDVQGGTEQPWFAAGCIDADPGFIDPDGLSNTLGTADDDLRLGSGSPCIDAGDNTAVTVTTDFDGNARRADDPTVDPDPGNGMPPVVDMGAYEYQADCNANGIIDSQDIAAGTCPDDNCDGVPDVCETDCNGDWQYDVLDIAHGTSADCNDDGVPDECQPDCDGDGTPDVCELPPYGTSEDCTGNTVPDECETDCNDNDVADSCDIADGTSVDGNDNGIPDSCEMPVYNIGLDIDGIPAQVAGHGGTVEFLVYSSELGDGATFSVVANRPPVGPIAVDSTTGYFLYTPDPADKRAFNVTFTAALGSNSVSQDVLFEPTLLLSDEAEVIGLEPVHPVPDPESRDYIVRNEAYRWDRYNLADPLVPLECCGDAPCLSECESFNWYPRNPRSITIAGKTLIVETGHENGLYEYDDNEEIAELTIFAETVVVRSPLHFPQTNVTIYARVLRFEDDSEWTYIDTTPKLPPSLSPGAGDGGAGLKAGDITLHLQNFQAAVGDQPRFIMRGGEGQDGANGSGEEPPGMPGGGGSAGNLYANQASLPHPACAGGLPGAPGWVGDPRVYAALPDVPFGESGSVVPVGNEWSWLTPDALRMILAHAKDAYLYGQLDYAEAVVVEYRALLDTYRQSDAWDALDDPERDENWQFELTQLLEETVTLLHRLENNLDYFGNPAGWVPMLSFEVNLAAFAGEVDRSIRAIYFAYWVGNAFTSLEEKINGLSVAREQMRTEIDAYQTQYEALIDLIPSLEAQALDIANQIDQRIIELQQLEQELLALAQEIVEERNKVPFWKKVLRTLGGICKILPVGEPYVGMVGKGLDFVSNIDPNQPWSSITGQADVVTEVSQGGFAQATSDWLSALNDVDLNAPSDEAISAMLGAFSPVGQTLQGLGNVIRQTQAPRTEVEAELQRIKASDPRFIELTNLIEELINEKAALARQLASAMQMVSDLAGRISHNVLAIDGLSREVSEGTAALDHRVARYVTEMDRRARERLQKYHYNMAKAYEYRLLQPYEGDLNLGAMLTLIENLATADGSPAELTPEQVDSFRVPYEQELAAVGEAILDDYNVNPPELSTRRSFGLSADQLDALNAGEPVALNLANRGLAQPNEENIRIVDFIVAEIEVHAVGGECEEYAYFDLWIEHSGESRLRSDGNTYKFVHYTEDTERPIRWGANYDYCLGSVDPIAPSAASESLLRSLLPELTDEDALIYSRPAFDSDLSITKVVHTSNPIDLVIDSLRFEIRYDFWPQSSGRRGLNVRVSEDGLLPYFIVNPVDRYGRQDGRGSFFRSYWQGEGVTVEAPTSYGSWEFEKWTDRWGNDLPGGPAGDPELELNLNENQVIVAQFCRFGLLADVPKLVSCMNGPSGQTASYCFCVDDDDDGDVDLADFAALQRAFEGF